MAHSVADFQLSSPLMVSAGFVYGNQVKDKSDYYTSDSLSKI